MTEFKNTSEAYLVLPLIEGCHTGMTPKEIEVRVNRNILDIILSAHTSINRYLRELEYDPLKKDCIDKIKRVPKISDYFKYIHLDKENGINEIVKRLTELSIEFILNREHQITHTSTQESETPLKPFVPYYVIIRNMIFERLENPEKILEDLKEFAQAINIEAINLTTSGQENAIYNSTYPKNRISLNYYLTVAKEKFGIAGQKSNYLVLQKLKERAGLLEENDEKWEHHFKDKTQIAKVYEQILSEVSYPTTKSIAIVSPWQGYAVSWQNYYTYAAYYLRSGNISKTVVAIRKIYNQNQTA